VSKIPILSNVVRGAASKASKIAPVSMDRTVAQAPSPSTEVGTGENRIQVSTFFTAAGGATQILYPADRIWTRVTLILETAGPVAVGQSSNLRPVLSGIGQLLQTGVPTTFNVAKNNKLYIAANSVNRVTVIIEPYAWLETITALSSKIMSLLGGVMAKVV
jgi:hypothetical protein